MRVSRFDLTDHINIQRSTKGASGKGPRQKTSKVVKHLSRKLSMLTFFDNVSRVKNRQRIERLSKEFG